MRGWLVYGIGILSVSAVIFLIAAFFLLRDNVDELMKEAFELRDRGRLDEAADLFGQVALLYPQSPRAPEALFERGDTFKVYGDPAAPEKEKAVNRAMAEEAFRRLIVKYPDSPNVFTARRYLGEIYTAIAADARERGDDEEALDNYSLALDQYEAVVGRIEDPEERQEMLLVMAECHEGKREYSKAAVRCRDVIELGMLGQGRCFERAHLVLINYYHMAGEYEMVVAQLRELLRFPVPQATKQMAHLRLAGILLDLNRFEEAGAALEQVIPTESNRDLIQEYKEIIESREVGVYN
jgi:tetratricopeptide (TPR) repeat protein